MLLNDNICVTVQVNYNSLEQWQSLIFGVYFIWEKLVWRGHLCFVIFNSFLQNFENIYICAWFVVFNCDLLWCLSFDEKKKVFLCVAYNHYPNMFWIFFIYKKYWKFWKMCFRMDFLNTTKNYFIAFLDFTSLWNSKGYWSIF